MMRAWISGASQQAIISSDNTYRLINNGSGKARIVSKDEVSALTEEWDDAYALNIETLEAGRRELKGAVWSYNALLISSLAIDGKPAATRREEAAIEAERLLQEEFAFLHVLNAYCAHPMPAGADLESALFVCERNDLSRLGEIIKTVRRYEGRIRLVWEAWDSIKTDVFGGGA